MGTRHRDLKAYDLEGNGVEDVIASYDNQVVWFENPRNTGGDPTAGPWPMHAIGPDQGHEVILGDFDGDGRIDVVTDKHIYFQNSPTDWTTISAENYGSGNRSQVGVALFDSGSTLGAVDLTGTGPASAPSIGWFENPRDHGGNARTDPWTFHAVGPNYSTDPGAGLTYQSFDVNGDGGADILTAQNERGNLREAAARRPDLVGGRRRPRGWRLGSPHD